LAFEHRIAAAIADPGVFDVFAPWAEAIPPELLKLLDAGDQQAFDQMFNEGMQSAPPAQRQNWNGVPSRTGCNLRTMCSPQPAATTSPTWLSRSQHPC
jgi:hypothetical protein